MQGANIARYYKWLPNIIIIPFFTTDSYHTIGQKMSINPGKFSTAMPIKSPRPSYMVHKLIVGADSLRNRRENTY